MHRNTLSRTITELKLDARALRDGFSAAEVESGAKALIEATPEFWEYPMCDRDPLPRWSHGRVTLLGDAAHPMLQYLAQGACMATEDAVVLAEKVAAQLDDLPAAFKAYEQNRYLRTGRTQIMARVYGEFYHARGVTAELRDMALAAPPPSLSRRSAGSAASSAPLARRSTVRGAAPSTSARRASARISVSPSTCTQA